MTKQGIIAMLDVASQEQLDIISAVLVGKYRQNVYGACFKKYQVMVEGDNYPNDIWKDCPACKGTGKFDNEHLGGHFYGVKCPNCHGSGKVKNNE